jgi:hypothetical protein
MAPPAERRAGPLTFTRIFNNDVGWPLPLENALTSRRLTDGGHAMNSQQKFLLGVG